MQTRDWLFIAAMLWALFHALGDKIPTIVPPTNNVTAVVYVFEKDDTAVPGAVSFAMDKINRDGIEATIFDDDIVDGTGEVPDQYKIALAAAREAGMPVLVVLAGDKVVRVVKAPTTEQAVMEAIR